jgi:alkylhydroperoxidase family enzyme
MASHTAALRRLKVPEEKIAAIHTPMLDKEVFSEQELVVLELADRVAESGHAVSEALWERLRQFFDYGEIIEIVCALGLFNYFNRLNDALHMEITR